uniref:Uncharacterized protein n=1 Tax=Pithovirus LCPAC401 TaxID=2506595 RepID=A0A481ZBY6_9VIRU|nr:MAG: hypothetical protein LCPAC401_02880 [Pithovirus LCPAC401]
MEVNLFVSLMEQGKMDVWNVTQVLLVNMEFMKLGVYLAKALKCVFIRD